MVLSVTACAGGAMGQQQAIWVARGTTEHLRRVQSANLLARPGSIFTVNALAASTDYFANWMTPTVPGGVVGSSSSAAPNEVDSLDHAVIADDLHDSREVYWHDDGLPASATGLRPVFKSLRITTQGDLTIVGNGLFGPTDWLIRDPECTGVHVSSVHALNTWIGGTGSLMLTRGSSGGDLLTKSGPGTLVLNPALYSSNGTRGWAWGPGFNIHDGTLAFWGTGAPYMIDGGPDVIRIGAEYGGVDFPPASIPPASWSPFPVSPGPTVKRPRALIQADNIVAPGNVVKMGLNSTLQFEAPEPVSFLGNVVCEGSGPWTVTVRAEPLEAVTFAPTSLEAFRGAFRIERGVARLQAAPNGFVGFTLVAPTYPYEAVLELKVPGAGYTFGNTVTGMGRVLKWGPGTLSFVGHTTSFAGDFVVDEGMLVLPPSASVGTLRNAVSVDGPTSVLNQQASDAVADNTAVSLDDSGRWLLNGRTDTISRVKLVNNARLELGGGTLTLGGGVLEVVHTPGGTTTATVAGPGTLASTVPLAVDSFDALAPIDLDIQATLAAPSVLFSGPATVRLAGSGAGGPALTVQNGVLRLARTGVDNAAGALTIGDPGHGLWYTPEPAVVLNASNQLPDNKPVTMNVRGLLNLNGFTDTIGGLVVNGAGPFAVGAEGGELGLAGAASFTGTGVTSVYGPLNLLGGSRNWTINAGATVFMTGTVNSGTLSKLGPGALFLDNVNGSFTLSNSGSTTSATRTSVGGVAGSGTIFLDTSFTIDTPAATQRGYGGAFAGAGALIKTGPGTQELNAGVANTHTGGTRVEGGTLFLNRFPGTTVIPGNITIADGGTLLFAGGASNQIADAADVTVDAGGVVRMDGQSETIRNLALSGDWTVDRADGTPGDLRVTQSAVVLGGSLRGTVSGGALSVLNGGVADIRGTLPSVSVGAAGTLAVGGRPGSDQLTITGDFAMFNSTSRLTFTAGAPTDPALVRAVGTLTYPAAGQVQVRVNQFSPHPAGTAIRLIDFGTGASVPDLGRYALIVPLSGSGRGRLTLEGRVLSYVVVRNPCAADADGDGVLNVADIFAFLSQWFAGSAGGDFDLSGVRDVSDIFSFLGSWFAGC